MRGTDRTSQHRKRGHLPALGQSQPTLRDVLDRLDTEHHAIHDVFEKIDAALIHLVQHPADLDPVTEAIDLLTDTLLSHFAYEEDELVGPLARYELLPGSAMTRARSSLPGRPLTCVPWGPRISAPRAAAPLPPSAWRCSARRYRGSGLRQRTVYTNRGTLRL